MKYVAGLLCIAALCATPALADEPDVASVTNLPSPKVSEGPIKWFENFATSEVSTPEKDLLTPDLETDKFALTWNGSGRWGLTLDVTRRSENQILPQEEIQAGAYYQITPRFRFGGGISIGGKELSDASRWTSDEAETGVRIESAFTF